jgi:hypothetical protein
MGPDKAPGFKADMQFKSGQRFFMRGHIQDLSLILKT